MHYRKSNARDSLFLCEIHIFETVKNVNSSSRLLGNGLPSSADASFASINLLPEPGFPSNKEFNFRSQRDLFQELQAEGYDQSLLEKSSYDYLLSCRINQDCVGTFSSVYVA